MAIQKHKLTNTKFIKSPNQSGGIDPRFIVMHYTAGWTADSAISVLTRKGSNVSAHLVIETTGEVTQLVPFDRKAWHAGPSTYMGYNGLNSYSIGIEIVNPGFQRKLRNGKYQDAYGVVRSEEAIGDMVIAPNARVGSGDFYWPIYTKEQLNILQSITSDIVTNYKILDIVSHEEIDTRGWKTDPGPAFPMKIFKSMLPDRNTDSLRYEITAATLNVRGGPGGKYTVIGKVGSGDIVEVLNVKGSWGQIDADGWIYMGYAKRI